MAIAEHQPGKLYKRNRSLLSMTRAQLHDFASGPVKGKGKRRKGKRTLGNVGKG